MTVSATLAEAPFIWTGNETTFACGFHAKRPEDISAYHRATVSGLRTDLVRNVNFTVSIDPETELVTVQRISFPAAQGTITVERNSSYLQPNIFAQGEAIPAAVHQQLHDGHVLRDQELRRDVDRALVASGDLGGAVDDAIAARDQAQIFRNQAQGFRNEAQIFRDEASTFSPQAVQRVSSIANLRGLTPSATRRYFVDSYVEGENRGFATYLAVVGQPAGTFVDDGGAVIVPTGGNGSAAFLLSDEGAFDIRQFNVRGNGTENDTAGVLAWIKACETYKRVAKGGAGQFLLTAIDTTIASNMKFDLHPDCEFLGSQSWQRFDAFGVTTSFLITAFDFIGSNGLNIEVVNIATGRSDPSYGTELSPGVRDGYLVEGVHYTRAGLNLDMTGGSAPVGALPSTVYLYVTSSAPMMVLRRTGGAQIIEWTGGHFNTSNRGWALARASGTSLTLTDWPNVEVDKLRAWAGNTKEETQAARVGDTGLGLTRCFNAKVAGCRFQGMGDIGIYGTGGGDAGTPADDGGRHTYIGNWFINCVNGLKNVRQARHTEIIANHFIECATGLTNGNTGTPAIPAGESLVIMANQFIRTGRRAIDLRSMPTGAIVVNNIIEDVGFQTDGVTPYAGVDGVPDPGPLGMFLSGVANARVTGNQIRLRDWANTNNQTAIQVNSNTFPGGAIAYADNVKIYDNDIAGFARGVLESGSADRIRRCRYTGNHMKGVATPYTIVSPSTRFSWIDEDTGETWRGRGPIGSTPVWRESERLWIDGPTNPRLRISEGASTNEMTELVDFGGGVSRLFKICATGPATFGIDPQPLDGAPLSQAVVQLFRNTNAISYLDIYVGDGTSAVNHRLNSRGANSYLCGASGNLGVGVTTPDYKLAVVGSFCFRPGASVTPVNNGDITAELTNNTTITWRARGSDGVVRSGTVTLS